MSDNPGRVADATGNWVDGSAPAKVLPALGTFNHEAVAVDAANRHLYLTEDRPDGAFFRFVPSSADCAPARRNNSGRSKASTSAGPAMWPEPMLARPRASAIVR